MIDYGRVLLPIHHAPIYGGELMSVLPDGSLEWTTPKRIMAEGTFSNKISFKSAGGDGSGFATHLWVNGNPSKFLQGHNVFGSDDFISLMFDTFNVIAQQFGLNPTPAEVELIRSGDYELKTVDINYSFSLPSKSDVLSFIRALEFRAKTRHGRPSTKGGTLYFGKSSSYWAFKFYCKAEEILRAGHQLPEQLRGLGIEDWVQNKLRAELRLMSKQLQRLGIFKASDLHVDRVRQLFNEYLRQIDMSGQVKLQDNEIEELPTKLKTTYTLWKEGHDLRFLMNRRTYERHRKELKSFGINIDLDSVTQHESNVVPFIRILEAKPAEVPQWAFEKGVVHHSAKAAL